MLSLDDILDSIDENLRDKRADLIALLRYPYEALASTLALRRPPKED